MSQNGELRREDKCAIIEPNNTSDNKRRKITMDDCLDHEHNNKWILSENTYIKHVLTGLCLDGTGATHNKDVYAAQCTKSRAQRWQFDYYVGKTVPK